MSEMLFREIDGLCRALKHWQEIPRVEAVRLFAKVRNFVRLHANTNFGLSPLRREMFLSELISAFEIVYPMLWSPCAVELIATQYLQDDRSRRAAFEEAKTTIKIALDCMGKDWKIRNCEGGSLYFEVMGGFFASLDEQDQAVIRSVEQLYEAKLPELIDFIENSGVIPDRMAKQFDDIFPNLNLN